MNRQYLQQQLDQLMADTLALGSRVEEALTKALKAIAANDIEAMQQVVGNDRLINAATQELHSRCITIIARQQPMAGDLRDQRRAVLAAGDGAHGRPRRDGVQASGSA